MKPVIPFHKTPKFGDLSPEPLGKTTLLLKDKKRAISNHDINKPPQTQRIIKQEQQKPLNSIENRLKPPKPGKKTDVVEKKIDRIMELKEKPGKTRSKTSLDGSDAPPILKDSANETKKNTEICEKQTEKQNIKEKIDFINQIFESINNKRVTTEKPPSESGSPERSPEQSLEENFKKRSSLETDEEEEDINPRKSQVFPESISISQDPIAKSLFQKKQSKEELSKPTFDTKPKQKSPQANKKPTSGNSSLLREKNFIKETNIGNASFLREKPVKKIEKPSQSPLKKTFIRNFVQANKRNNGLGKKMYENFEKLLKCFESDVTNKTMLQKNYISKSPMRTSNNVSPLKQREITQLSNFSNISPIRMKAEPPKKNPKEEPRKVKQNKVTLSRDSRKINDNQYKNKENKENVDMKSFYKEISNLTKTLSKAAAMMTETFHKMETMGKTPQKTRNSSQDSDQN